MKRKTGAAGGVGRLDEITQISGSGELLIQSVRVDGTSASIGGTGARGTITANVIDEIVCDGNINANITTTTTSAFSAANLNFVQSVNGSITGNIQAPNGQVGTVEATSGTIGTPGDLADILSANFINAIRAQAIYANIHGVLSGGKPTAGPGFALIKATSGGFHGSILQTDTSGGGGERGLLVTGGLNSNVQFTCCPGNPITIAGGIGSSGQLAIAGDCASDLNIDALAATKTVTIGGSLTGDLSVGGGSLAGQ